jgi:penicillin amidase
VALAIVAAWDGDTASDSAAALVFQVWSGHVARRRLLGTLGEDLFGRYAADREVWHCQVLPALVHDPEGKAEEDLLAAFDDTMAELRDRFGNDESAWRWGAVHRLRLAHPLADIPGLDPLFTAVDAEVGGDETTVCQTAFDAREGFDVAVIPSWRAVYDLADLDRSVGVLPAGNSGNPASPHWNDQAPLWLGGETHALPFSAAAVEAASVAECRLVPGSISG